MANFKELKEIDDNRDILQKLDFHLESQAKPSSDKCSPEYLGRLKKELVLLKKAVDKILD